MGIAWTVLHTTINPLLYGHQLPAPSSPLYHWRAYEKWSNSLKKSMCILWLKSFQMPPLLQKKIRLLPTALEMAMASFSLLSRSLCSSLLSWKSLRSSSWSYAACHTTLLSACLKLFTSGFYLPDPMPHATPPCSLPIWSSSLPASAGAISALAFCSFGLASRRLFALQALTINWNI